MKHKCVGIDFRQHQIKFSAPEPQVQKLPMRDHNAPALAVLVYFCKQATAWLNEHPTNVVAVNITCLSRFPHQ